MKRTFLLLAVAVISLWANAQRTVSGKVIDGDLNEPAVQATVALLAKDSSLVSNAVTDMNGLFKLTAPRDGSFLLRVTYVGFKTTYKSVAMKGKPVAVGTISLKADAIMLQGAEIVRNVAKVTTKDDSIIYNASAYRTPEGSVVEELVKKLPGAEVSDDGTIKINGKEVKKILVDGKEFMTGDTKTAMKNLPTSIVDRIKTYDEKSDMSRITGVDDGNDQTVLDFGLKRGMNRGMFANVDAGMGTKSRYSSRGMAAMMKDDWRVMAMGNANNVNDMGFFGGGGGGRFGGGGRSGLQASKSGAVNFNYEKKDKLSWNGSLRWNHNDGDAWSRRSTENFVSQTGSFGESTNQNYSRSNAWNAQMRLEWKPDTLTTINFRPSWSYSTNDGHSHSTSATFSDDPHSYTDQTRDVAHVVATMLGIDSALVVNDNGSRGLSYSDSKRVGGNLLLSRRIGKGGRNVTAQFTGNYSKGASEQMSTNLVNLYHALTADSTTYQTNRYNVTPQKSYDYSAKFSWSEPIAKAMFLQFSYQFQYRYTRSDRDTYDFSWNAATPLDERFNMGGISAGYRQWDRYLGMVDNYTDYRDDDLSRFSLYKNYIHTAEVMFRMVGKKLNFNVGVQVVPQSSKFQQRYRGVNTDTIRHTINWIPTARLRWKFSERGQMNFDYRGTTSQPSMTDLLEITDNSDPLNITTGNRGLKPSFTQRFNWRYNNYIEKHQRFIFAFLNFSTTSNAVANKVTYNPVTGGRTSRPENINGNWNIGGTFVLNTALDTLGRFNISTGTDLNYSNQAGFIDLERNGIVSKMSTQQTSMSERLGGSYRNDWLEFELNGRVTYNYVHNKLQPQSNLSTWAFNYGFNTTVTAPWGTQLTTSLNMSSRRGYSDKSANTNELIWNAQIAQSFLRGRPLSVRLEFYDLLHKQSNFSRNITAMMRSDNEYNSVNSYVMLRLNYRLNLFGTRESRRAMRGGAEGGPGMPPPPGGGGPRGGKGGGRPAMPMGGFGGPRF